MLTAVAASGAVEIIEKAIGKSAADIDMSLWGLIVHADFAVQVVILILLLGSIISWAIIANKIRKMKKLERQAEKFNKIFYNEESLESLHDRISRNPQDPYEEIFCAGMTEWKESTNPRKKKKNMMNIVSFSLQERIERVMRLSVEKEIIFIKQGLVFLATLASSAPFIGLFGTVWGIMSSFQSIAVHQNTNLAVVAPGIAEALFATAFGLFAAIPAVIFYNILSHSIRKYTFNLESFVDEFLNIVSRQIDDAPKEK